MAYRPGEQGITIDVAYRFFATDRRRYIVADTPGHEQYTCNMATGASTAQLAILLVDARKGILSQTRRHHRIVTMMGIRHIVLAVNKMDLVDFQENIFHSIKLSFGTLHHTLGLRPFTRLRSQPFLVRTYSRQALRCHGIPGRLLLNI